MSGIVREKKYTKLIIHQIEFKSIMITTNVANIYKLLINDVNNVHPILS